MRWSRLVLFSAFGLTAVAPGVALGEMQTDPNATPPADSCTCNSPCSQQAMREDVRQAAPRDSAQSEFQPATRQAGWIAPDRRAAQGDYQRGAGQRD
jgi:hypothetical protein